MNLMLQSLMLDYKFFKVSRWKLYKKLRFLLTKYYLIGKHMFLKFSLSRNYVFWENRKIYYDSKFGFAGYQSMLVRHQFLISDIAKIHKAKVIIDVGANVGFFTMLTRDIFSESKVYSFEPIKPTFICLKNNFLEDKNVKIYNMALSNFIGTAKMSYDKDNSATNSISKEGNEKVKVTTLDAFVRNEIIKEIDILKIDTETFENYVLMGAKNTLAITKYLLIEITLLNNNNYTISSLFKLLNCKKFNFQLVGFRNFSDAGEGYTPIVDMLLENITYKGA